MLAAILVAASLPAFVLNSAAQEWPRFRGPNGAGISHAKTIPTKITDADIHWKVELPGTGHSSPVLWGDRIFLTSTGDWNVFTQFHAPGSCGAQDYLGVDATSIPKLGNRLS